MTSPNGTKINYNAVTHGAVHIEDRNGDFWTQDTDTVFRRNGKSTGGYGVTLEIWDGEIYCSNGGFNYHWNGTAWIEYTGTFPPVGGNPSTDHSPSGTIVTVDSAVALKDAEGSEWTIAKTDFSILRNGIQSGIRGFSVEIWDTTVYGVDMNRNRFAWLGGVWQAYGGAWPPSNTLPVTFDFEFRTGVVLPSPGNIELKAIGESLRGPDCLITGKRAVGWQWFFANGTDIAGTLVYATLAVGPQRVKCAFHAVLTDGVGHIVGITTKIINVLPVVFPQPPPP